MKSCTTGQANQRRGTPLSRAMIVWSLVAGFLLQPVLAYLVTPVLTHDGNGQQVVVCTLKGEQIVTLDLPPIADDGSDSEHCLALKLYQTAGTTQVSEPPLVPARVLYAIERLDRTVGQIHYSRHFAAYLTRAPPIV